VLFVVAVAGRSPVPVFLAIPLLLAAPAAALAGPRATPRLTGRRIAEGSGPEVRVHGWVRTAERIDPNDLFVDAPCPPGMREAAAPEFERTPEEVRFRLAWRAREPTIVVAPAPSVVWRDSAGLVERHARLDLPDLVVERYPPELLRIGAVRLRRTMVLPGETLSRQVGPSGEFYSIREASPDDPSRRINWVASARSGRLLANEYQVDRTGDVLLLLDTRTTSLGRAIDERLLSISRAAAAGIAQSFLFTKARVGLGVFGEFLTPVPLGSGRAQHQRIRAALLAARLNPADAPSERCAVSLSRYFPPGVTTILFSTLADESLADLLPHLRRRGFPLIVLSPSPLPAFFEGPALDPEEEALVARLTRLLRRDQIARAWREAPTIDWDDYWSLGRFVEFLRRPATRRVG
jgi:uncharacterized protein (DUF58 family)